MTHETIKSIDRITRPSTLLMGAFLTAALVDTRLTRIDRRQRDDHADLVSTKSNKDLSIITLVGNGANGRQYAKQLGPHLEEFGSTHFVVYPENGFSAEAVGERILEASHADNDKRKAIFVSSMGEIVFNHLASNPEFAKQLGEVDFLISNDGLTSLTNLQPRIKHMLRVGAHLPVTKTTSSVYGIVRRTTTSRSLHHAPEITDEQAREHLRSTAATPLYALSAQWKNLLTYTPLAVGSLSDFGSRIKHKVHLTPAYDRIINADASYADKVALYGSFERVIDHEMPHGGHALAAEYPMSIKRILSRRVIDESFNVESHTSTEYSIAA